MGLVWPRSYSFDKFIFLSCENFVKCLFWVWFFAGPYGMQHPIGMGRGFPSYGAMGPGAGAATSGFAGAPGPSPAYGYGKFQPVISHP